MSSERKPSPFCIEIFFVRIGKACLEIERELSSELTEFAGRLFFGGKSVPVSVFADESCDEPAKMRAVCNLAVVLTSYRRLKTTLALDAGWVLGPSNFKYAFLVPCSLLLSREVERVKSEIKRGAL